MTERLGAGSACLFHFVAYAENYLDVAGISGVGFKLASDSADMLHNGFSDAVGCFVPYTPVNIINGADISAVLHKILHNAVFNCSHFNKTALSENLSATAVNCKSAVDKSFSFVSADVHSLFGRQITSER